MTLEEMAKIIEAEASVLPWSGKVAVAQCIRDNNFNAGAFTKPSDSYSASSLWAAEYVIKKGGERCPEAEILQFRSFKKYSDGHGNPDWSKLRGDHYGAVPDDLVYLGEDHLNEDWGTFLFGRMKKMRDFKMLLIAGHGTNVDGSFDPGAIGCGYREADLTRELVPLIKDAADRYGVPCDIAPDRNYYSYFKHGGSFDFTPYNYVLEIHFNASAAKSEIANGCMKGSMVYIDKGETGHSVEDNILQNLYDIGSKQAWDGVIITQRQYVNGLMVQNAVRAQGVSECVLETCFITDADDMQWYHSKKVEIADAVIRGIITGFGLNSGSTTNTSYCGTGIATAVAKETMNVRSADNLTASVIGIVPEGVAVEVLSKLDNGWLRIVWPGAACGYAFTSNINGAYWKYI